MLPLPLPFFLRTRAPFVQGCVISSSLCISGCWYYDRKIAYLWSTYGFLCTFARPPLCNPFCCSRDRVYISVLAVNDIPDLIFTLLSHYSSHPRQLGLMCSGQHYPPARCFSPRGDPRGVGERPAVACENEITFIAASREYHHRAGRSPPLQAPQMGVGRVRVVTAFPLRSCHTANEGRISRPNTTPEPHCR